VVGVGESPCKNNTVLEIGQDGKREKPQGVSSQQKRGGGGGGKPSTKRLNWKKSKNGEPDHKLLRQVKKEVWGPGKTRVFDGRGPGLGK